MKKERILKTKNSPAKNKKYITENLRTNYNDTMGKVNEYFGIDVPRMNEKGRVSKKNNIVTRVRKNTNFNFSNEEKEKISKRKIKSSRKNNLPKLKIAMIFLLTIAVLSGSYSWFYSEFTSKGTIFGVGKLECEISQYSSTGELIGVIGDTGTLIQESDIAAGAKTTKYLELENTGSLDLQYNITFNLDDQEENSGIMYYRLYDITEEVQQCEVTALYDTKLKMYAHKNPIDSNIEFDTARPVYNMTIIDTTITNGIIELDLELEENNKKYYRLDYGVYSTANASIYSEKSFSLHTNVYISQVGSEFKRR